MKPFFSIIIPVYNRPEEIDELLVSISAQEYDEPFEVCIVEDGSSEKSDLIINKYTSELSIQYFETENTGPGSSRNYGMTKATGNYFIILDSDVILPYNYLAEITKQLEKKYTDAFGGPDAAHPSFSVLQKAINYSMTSFLTTGGIRGIKKVLGNFNQEVLIWGFLKKLLRSPKAFQI